MFPQIYPNTKALIFDLDGTLADSLPVHNYCWKEVCKPFNYIINEELLYQMTGMPTIKFAEFIKEQSGCTLEVEDIMNQKQAVFNQLVHTIRPFQKMMDFVTKYHGILPMSIGTGGGKSSSMEILKTIGMQNYFPIVITAEDVTHHKPAPDTFLKCAEMMGVQPAFCQVFEDGPKGMEAAITAGMMVIDVRQYY